MSRSVIPNVLMLRITDGSDAARSVVFDTLDLNVRPLPRRRRPTPAAYDRSSPRPAIWAGVVVFSNRATWNVTVGTALGFDNLGLTVTGTASRE